jgi:hypothetical protein
MAQAIRRLGLMIITVFSRLLGRPSAAGWVRSKRRADDLVAK